MQVFTILPRVKWMLLQDVDKQFFKLLAISYLTLGFYPRKARWAEDDLNAGLDEAHPT